MNKTFHMRKLYLMALLSLVTWGPLSAQQLSGEQIHRFGDYGKLWCVIKLFHPEMAYNTINPDSLFTDNIGDLLNDPSAANFKKAVQKMIDRLHDPYTVIQGKKTVDDSAQLPERPLLTWLDDSTALVYFSNEFMRESGSDFSANNLKLLIDSIRNAHGIIIDLRQTTSSSISDDYAPWFMKQLVSYIVSQKTSFPSSRTRIHYGHESETFNSEFYYQGWVLQNGSAIKPKPNAIRKPMCLLINRFDANIIDAIAALQHNGVAKVVADDSLNDFAPASVYPMQLSDSVTVNVRLSEVLYSNGNKTFSPDEIVYRNNSNNDDSLLHAAIQLLNSNNEVRPQTVQQLQNVFTTGDVEGYDSLKYPPAPLRLLGLMRYWSAIQYFCPNKDMISKNWDSVLYEYVPKFLEAKDSLSYALTAGRLIKEINDCHGFFGSYVHDNVMSDAPQIQLNFVENKTIVYKIFNDSLKSFLSIGDEVIAVDGRPIKKCRDSVAQYIGASNESSLQRDVTAHVLAGPSNSFVNITYDHNGASKTIKLQRTVPWYQYYFVTKGTGPVWKKMSDKIGYVDFGRLEVQQIDSVFNDLKETDAIILDDRSYPRGTVWTLVNYLTDKTVYGASGGTMIADSPDPHKVTRQEELWPIPVTPNPLQYKGRIVVLVNATTQSQAEYSCMVLQAAYKKVSIIGSQTAGADGDITGIKFPGGIYTAFSGHGVHYPDGRPTQGIGIVPDIKITPTINGIKAGKDEVLERAIEFAKTGK